MKATLLQVFTAICKTAKLLKTRYTARGFWLAGQRLYEAAEVVVKEPEKARQLKAFAADARQHLGEAAPEERPAEPHAPAASKCSSYS